MDIFFFDHFVDRRVNEHNCIDNFLSIKIILLKVNLNFCIVISRDVFINFWKHFFFTNLMKLLANIQIKIIYHAPFLHTSIFQVDTDQHTDASVCDVASTPSPIILQKKRTILDKVLPPYKATYLLPLRLLCVGQIADTNQKNTFQTSGLPRAAATADKIIVYYRTIKATSGAINPTRSRSSYSTDTTVVVLITVTPPEVDIVRNKTALQDPLNRGMPRPPQHDRVPLPSPRTATPTLTNTLTLIAFDRVNTAVAAGTSRRGCAINGADIARQLRDHREGEESVQDSQGEDSVSEALVASVIHLNSQQKTRARATFICG